MFADLKHREVSKQRAGGEEGGGGEKWMDRNRKHEIGRVTFSLWFLHTREFEEVSTDEEIVGVESLDVERQLLD